MGVIVGAATSITGDFSNAISVNWGASPNSQRLYVLGSVTPFKTIKKPTETLSITVYSKGPAIDVAAATKCEEASEVTAGISSEACGDCGEGASVDGPWYLTSYSFSKEVGMPGQESFSMMKYIKTGTDVVPPSLVIRGVAEGSWTPDSGVTSDVIDGESKAGSVSAGGVGRSDTMSIGTVTKVGAAGAAIGVTGQASVSIPYIPIYC
jgi:hypothetical protein